MTGQDRSKAVLGNHSPGPWSAERKDDGCLEIVSPCENVPHVATVPAGFYHEPNAPLIASAPELLKALQIAEYRLGELHWDMVNIHDEPCPSDCRTCGEIASIQAVIASAGGGESFWHPIDNFFAKGG
tara:strand:+ start:315 stop:698 length:384 start_codon:yes stop_codon:yes gene_type:complete